MGDEMLGAVQQAPHPGRQSIASSVLTDHASATLVVVRFAIAVAKSPSWHSCW